MEINKRSHLLKQPIPQNNESWHRKISMRCYKYYYVIPFYIIHLSPSIWIFVLLYLFHSHAASLPPPSLSLCWLFQYYYFFQKPKLFFAPYIKWFLPMFVWLFGKSAHRKKHAISFIFGIILIKSWIDRLVEIAFSFSRSVSTVSTWLFIRNSYKCDNCLFCLDVVTFHKPTCVISSQWRNHTMQILLIEKFLMAKLAMSELVIRLMPCDELNEDNLFMFTFFSYLHTQNIQKNTR